MECSMKYSDIMRHGEDSLISAQTCICSRAQCTFSYLICIKFVATTRQMILESCDMVNI